MEHQYNINNALPNITMMTHNHNEFVVLTFLWNERLRALWQQTSFYKILDIPFNENERHPNYTFIENF